MGKRQHQKDKLYLTCTEWSTIYGGKRPTSERKDFRRLPFDHCCLSLQPFNDPLCSPEGYIFDLEAIVPFIKKFKINPCTGKPMSSKSLLKLKIHKNIDGRYHCPVMFKEFTDNSHIVAIKTTGNVFSFDAVEQMNIRTKNWKELLTDEAFTKEDIITLQDPADLEKFNLQTFHHIVNNITCKNEDPDDPMNRLKNINTETKDILKALSEEYKDPEKKQEKEKKKPDQFNKAHYSTGVVATGLTSTVMPVETVQQPEVIEDDVVIYMRVKKKGYVRLVTNVGPLNLELYCDSVPKTCHNFLKLAGSGYYDGTIFHRSIRNFVIQGGDPTGTGKGGESSWKKPFEDEIKTCYSHTGRGVLSMANSGPNTNTSQFFITFRSCKHLDRKHAIFGRLVGGTETLTTMEMIETDNKDRPIEDIIIQKAQVFVDPFEEAAQQLQEERQQLIEEKEAELANLKKEQSQKEPQQLKVYTKGVGKYINPTFKKKRELPTSDSSSSSNKKQNVTGYQFKDFSGW